jgi:hypothetical protein
MKDYVWIKFLYFHPIYRTLITSLLSSVLAGFLPIASPPAPIDLNVYCKNLNLESIIKDSKQREISINLCKENSKTIIASSIQFTWFQYFIVQWMLYLATIASIITLLAAYESKSIDSDVDVWSKLAKSLNKNDLYEVCKHFGQSLSQSNLLKDYTSPLSDNFWNFYSRDLISKESLLSAFLSSYHLLSDKGKDTMKTVVDPIILQTFTVYSIDDVAMYFLDCCFKFGNEPELKHLRSIAIVHTLIEFKSTSQGSISGITLPQSLDLIPFYILKWEPVLIMWTTLAKFVKDPIKVDLLYNNASIKPSGFNEVNSLFISLFN